MILKNNNKKSNEKEKNKTSHILKLDEISLDYLLSILDNLSSFSGEPSDKLIAVRSFLREIKQKKNLEIQIIPFTYKFEQDSLFGTLFREIRLHLEENHTKENLEKLKSYFPKLNNLYNRIDNEFQLNNLHQFFTFLYNKIEEIIHKKTHHQDNNEFRNVLIGYHLLDLIRKFPSNSNPINFK